jgi:hypothetical protein
MTQEALKLLVHEMEYVLSCINEDKIPFDGDDFHEALRLGKEALAQTQEPHGWYIDGYGAVIGTAEPKSVRVGEWLPWYTATPQRTWVGLTDEERIEIDHLALSRVQAVQMTEAKLKELNT